MLVTLFLLALPAEHHELFAAEANASSFLVSNWNKFNENYHPSYVLDGDPKTAWVEGKDGNGEGEWIRIETTHLKTARQLKLEIRNGYQKSNDLFSANAMPKEIDVVALGPALEEIAQKRFVLDKKQGWQEVLLDLPGNRPFGGVQLKIVSVYEGRVYKDTCISDIRVHVDSDVKYDAAFEQKKRAALLKWTKERKNAAAYFKKLPREYPFASTQLRLAAMTDAEAEIGEGASSDKAVADVRAKKIVDDTLFQLQRPEMIFPAAKPKKVRVAPIGKMFPPEGGPDELELLMSFVDTNAFAAFETSKDQVKVAKDEWMSSKSVKSTWTYARDDGTLAGVCIDASFESDSEREGGAELETACVAFNAEGKATTLARRRAFRGLDSAADDAVTTTLVRLERDENGKISALDVQTLEHNDWAVTVRRQKYSAVPDKKS